MKALFISDEKPKEPLRELAKDCEIIILLGDLSYEWIRELKNINVPIIGINGNHDFDSSMNSDGLNPVEKIGGTRLHLNTFTHKGVRFAGFSCDLSYVFAENNVSYWKGEDASILRENLKKIEMLGEADVFLTHMPSMGTLDTPHILGRRGLKAFRDYIDRVRPKYHFHGHMHKPQTTKINRTEVTCVFPYLIKDI